MLRVTRDTIGVGVTLTIKRRWSGDAGWTNRETYRHAGVMWMHPQRWYHLRLGWHVDTRGRLYVYLGRVNVWQSLYPLRKRSSERKPFSAKRWGPIEWVNG